MKRKNQEDFDPSICVSNKVRQLNRVLANIYRKHFSPFNLTDSQVTILFLLTKQGSLTQKDMCQALLLEKSSLNRNLKRLFERELISKRDFPLIKLTDAGVQQVEHIIPAWEKAMAETKNLLDNDGMASVELLNNKIKS